MKSSIVTKTTRKWHYTLSILRPDESLALCIDLTDEQADAIHSALKPDLDDPEWAAGEYIVPDVYIGAVREDG